MTWSRFIPAGAFVVLVIFLGIGLTRDPSLIPTEMIDREMPAFDLPELRDEASMVSDQDLVGQVALVNVFGSWCVACLQEHPTLMQLKQDDTVRLVGVNWRDTRPKALAWLQRHGDPYDTIVFDEESDLAIEIGVTGAPETFIIDRTGRIRFKQIGPITPDVWRRTIRPVLDALAAEEVTTPAPINVEPRVDAVAKTLRCLSCQDQSVFESQSTLANDFRQIIRTLIADGKADDEIRDYFRERYGDSVLMSASAQTALVDAELIESRTEAVSKTLRCVVCQNQSIYDSNAPLAQDMRRLVRKRVAAGDNDDEVRAYLRYRYGDYVLMSPPLQLNTVLLWGTPLGLVMIGLAWFILRRRGPRLPDDDTMSDADRARVAAALAEHEADT